MGTPEHGMGNTAGAACSCSLHAVPALAHSALLAGWWFCQLKTKRGWVPAAYLEPMDGPDESEEQEPNYAGKRLRKPRRSREHHPSAGQLTARQDLWARG